jgi:transcriptional regulator with XRE-family HTH domain
VTGPQLMKIRKALGLDRKAFARKLGIARGLVKEYEESARVRKTVALAARALQAGLDDR